MTIHGGSASNALSMQCMGVPTVTIALVKKRLLEANFDDFPTKRDFSDFPAVSRYLMNFLGVKNY